MNRDNYNTTESDFLEKKENSHTNRNQQTRQGKTLYYTDELHNVNKTGTIEKE